MAMIDAQDAMPRTLGDLWDLPPEAQALARHALDLEDELERATAAEEKADERAADAESRVSDARYSLRKVENALAEVKDSLGS